MVSPTTYVLDGFALPGELAKVHDLLTTVGRDHPDIDQAALELFETAVLEIATNVVEHAEPPGGVRWHFELEVRDADLAAALSDDSGTEFTGDLHPEMPDELAEGGRGLPMAGLLLESLDYDRLDDRNVWTMVGAKRRS